MIQRKREKFLLNRERLILILKQEFADTYGMRFIETSAKTSANVEEAFVTMTKEIIREREKNMKKGLEKDEKKVVNKTKTPSEIKIKAN